MIKICFILILAVLPVWFVLRQMHEYDRVQPEPKSQLRKAFLLGILSVPLSLTLSIPFGLLGLYSDQPDSIIGAIQQSFFGAAIPEEFSKFLILWVVLRKNPYFDEYIDGIVYAVFVSMGFAALENIIYLFGTDSVLSTAISRAIFSIPGHFFFGIMMGYYFSFVRFSNNFSPYHRIMILVAPILAHGIYDTLLFIAEVDPEISALVIFLFLFYCNRIWKYGKERILEHLEKDNHFRNMEQGL